MSARHKTMQGSVDSWRSILIDGRIFKELNKNGFVAGCVALAWPQVGANRKNRLIACLGIYFSFEDGL
jgi:hypothetical protein